LDRRAQGRGTEFLKPGRDGTGHGEETFGSGCVFAKGSDGLARVAADADTRIDFDLTEHRNAVGAGGTGAFAVTEDVHRLAAVRAREARHVFDDAQNLDVDLAEHFNSFAYVGQRDRAPTFKPFIGCIPAAGGGSRVPTSFTAFRPSQPVTRRVKTVRVRPGTTTVVQRCASGERLVGGQHAFAFETRNPPSASLVSGVSGSATIGSSSVSVRVSGDAELAGVRALVQVQALCTRSR